MASLATVVEWLWEVSPVLKCWHESSKSSILWHLAKYQEKPRLRVLGAQEGTHGKNIRNSSLEKRLHVKKCPFRREMCNNSHCLFKILTSGPYPAIWNGTLCTTHWEDSNVVNKIHHLYYRLAPRWIPRISQHLIIPYPFFYSIKVNSWTKRSKH